MSRPRYKFLNYHGKMVHFSDLAKEHGISPNLLARRLGSGWDLEKALHQEPRALKKQKWDRPTYKDRWTDEPKEIVKEVELEFIELPRGAA